MSVFTRHRITFIACAALLAAPAVFAAAPSGRTATRMVFDVKTAHMILFGGTTKLDAGTRQSYDLDDTWEWNGDRWIQDHPAHAPHGRSFHTMVYDSNHLKTIVFGGKSGTVTTSSVEYNDTWTFDGNDWTQVNTPNAPQARIYSGATFNPIRDRMIIFGGTSISADGKTTTNLTDTWEFDGTTWTQLSATGPAVLKPLLVYDTANNRVIMIGSNDKSATLMYRLDLSNATWVQMTEVTALPTCAVDAQMVYQTHDNTIVLFGGVCTDSAVTGDTWEFDGTAWKKNDSASDPDRLSAEGMAYDSVRQQTMMFGGTLAFGSPTGGTHVYTNHVWSTPPDPVASPAGRSLFAFVSNPDQQLVWMFGGMNDTGLGTEFWQFQNGVWSKLPTTNGPGVCPTPNGVYDSNRMKLVVVCSDSTLYEWDGAVWKTISGLKPVPTLRSFSSMAYDATLKKTVLFGGFDGVNYINETWTWDGAAWTRVKNNPPTSRALAALWFDPTLKKTVLFGGIGRKSSVDRIERFNDMWSFDGSGWTQIKNVATVPDQRYGAQVAVDPRSGKVLLFGGLVLQNLGATQNQFYANDFWSWDGTTWTKVSTNGTPPPRENGALAYDPSTNRMVLFAGYSGFYLSDLWMLDSQMNWNLKAEQANPPVVIPPRRRGVH
jgi:hypothetical protein